MDNIVSARLITASGLVLTVSDSSYRDLFYAIKGAGQFFGIILSLTVKVHPKSILGSPEGTVWNATLIFPLSRAADVAAEALKVKAASKRSYLLVGVMPSPLTMDLVLMVIFAYLGTKAEGTHEFQALLDLGPVAVPADNEVPFGTLNDAFAAFETKGGFKNWLAPGLMSVQQFSPSDMEYLVEAQAKVGKEYPSAKTTAFVIEFTSHGGFRHCRSGNEIAFAHRDVANICVSSPSYFKRRG